MTKEKASAKKNEAEILFSEVDLDGVKIKPWSFGVLVDLAPLFRVMAEDVKKLGLTLEQISEIEKNPKLIFEIVTVLLPYAPEIIAKTVGLGVQDIRDWPTDKAAQAMMIILGQNMERIKNLSGLRNPLMTKLKMAG